MNKPKRQTVADFVNGAGVLGLLVTVGIYVYFPISRIIQSGKIDPIGELLPSFTALMAPFPVLAMSAILLFMSVKLKSNGTWFSVTYDKLDPGVLLLILLFSVWIVFPLVGAAVEALL